jgi:prepilin peptidase CpaA
MMFAAAMALGALGCVMAGAISDLRRYEIPNSLTIGLLLTAAAYGLATPGFAWASHAAAGGIMFAIAVLLFHLQWWGGGDAKLVTGVAVWSSLAELAQLGACIALAGGGLAAVLLIGRRLAAHRDPETLLPMLRRGGPVPYGVAIAAGALWWAARAWPIS